MKSSLAKFIRRLGVAAFAAAPALLTAQAQGIVTGDPNAVVLYNSGPALLTNLGVRGTLGPGETLISGFVVSEATEATVLVRAVGPTLTSFGVAGAMANPKLQIFDAKGNVVATNDDWSAETGYFFTVQQAAQLVGGFPLPTSSRDAAIVTTLAPGGYTLVISGSTNADTGVVLGEIYQLGTVETAKAAVENHLKARSRLANISARGRIAGGPAGEPVIGSFVVGSSLSFAAKGSVSLTVPGAPVTPPPEPPSKRFLIRVVGPGLAPYGVTDAVADPTLELIGTSGGLPIKINDNWDADAEAGKAAREMAATVGAFPLEPGSRDAVVIARLTEGSYSVIARGANGGAGTVLIEIYELAD